MAGNRSGPTLKAFQWEKKAKSAAKELDALAKAAKAAEKAQKKKSAAVAKEARGRTFGGAFSQASGLDKAKSRGFGGSAGAALGGAAARFGPAALAGAGLAAGAGVAVGIGKLASAGFGSQARGGEFGVGVNRFVDQAIASIPFGVGTAAAKRERVTEGAIADVNALTDELDRSGVQLPDSVLEQFAAQKRSENKRVEDGRERNRVLVEKQGDKLTALGSTIHEIFGTAGVHGAK